MEGSIVKKTNIIAEKYGVPEDFVKLKITEARNTGAYKALTYEADKAKKSKNYVMLSDVAYRSQKFEYDYVIEEIEKIMKETHTANELLSSMPKEDGYKADCAIHRLIFSLDYMESCSFDLMEIIKKYFPDVEIKNFETVMKLKKEASIVLRSIHANSTYDTNMLFGDIADELTEFADERIKKFLTEIQKNRKDGNKKI